MSGASDLPIEDALPDVLAALRTHNQAVLQAPPGAGKTTRVPLALLAAGLVKGKILMLEPRRLATRAAAERMAQTLGEPVGATVGYRMRGESRSGPQTRIEVVTEGILTRMIQSNAELPGIGAVIFDEFHERSLQGDLGLALALEIRAALREDLMLVVMSATLDAGPVAALMGDAPVITSEGRMFPVQRRWLDQPWMRPGQHANRQTNRHTNGHGPRFETALADLVEQAVGETGGGVLVFLPGEGEIRRLEGALKGRLGPDCTLHPLFGAMPFKAQRAAIAPTDKGRKIVLATSIAETSLTIEGVQVVIDGGRARRARFDASSGMSRLVTERVTKAEATQRQGRAGRLSDGVCYKFWTKGEEGGMAAFPPAEIEATDLAPLLLEVTQWGVVNPSDLPFLTPPNTSGVARARDLLQSLGALDAEGAITAHGRAMAALPLHPRLAHMVLRGGPDAPLLAALLSERDILGGAGPRAPADLDLRWQAARDVKKFTADRPYVVNRAVLARVLAETKRLRTCTGERLGLAEMAALAYPDRIGMRRKGQAPRYVLTGGKGAAFGEGEALGRSRLIVAINLDGDTREARIRQGVTFSEASLRQLFGDKIKRQDICRWSRRDRRVQTAKHEVLGALILSENRWPDCPPDQIAAAMCEGIRDLGIGVLPLGTPSNLLIRRVEWLRARDAKLPDFSDAGLLDDLAEWLAGYLGACQTPDDLKSVDLYGALLARLDWKQRAALDTLAPAAITAPTGTRLAVDYGDARPSISVRLQEMFGLGVHPTIGPDHLPLLIELLSPAGRPVQLTADLPGFWRDSYMDVRKDMRGRYPKHPWPENPLEAEATRRRKPRGT